MSEKFCIFCGSEPKSKNKEHVIPQWLIRLTGREKKDVFDGLPPEHRHLSFMQFTFPACEKCNSEFSELEAVVQQIMKKVLAGDIISGSEASKLMDWFDKVRIGLWLGEMYYNPELKKSVNPHLFIKSRVGAKDRMLNIRKMQLDSPEDKGILFGGTRTTWFAYCPSALTLVVNDYLFTNSSCDGLVSPHTGFPIVKQDGDVYDADKGVFAVRILNNKPKVVNPIVKDFIPHSDSISFYQPMYREIASQNLKEYINPYMQGHSYDISQGIGGVFYQRGNVNNIKYLKPDDIASTKIKATPKPDLGVWTVKNQVITANNSVFYGDMAQQGLYENLCFLKQNER